MRHWGKVLKVRWVVEARSFSEWKRKGDDQGVACRLGGPLAQPSSKLYKTQLLMRAERWTTISVEQLEALRSTPHTHTHITNNMHRTHHTHSSAHKLHHTHTHINYTSYTHTHTHTNYTSLTDTSHHAHVTLHIVHIITREHIPSHTHLTHTHTHTHLTHSQNIAHKHNTRSTHTLHTHTSRTRAYVSHTYTYKCSTLI